MSNTKGNSVASVKKVNGKRKGMSKEQLAERYDYKTKARVAITQALTRLEEGTTWTDSEMRAECSIGLATGWREVAEEHPFLAYQFRIGEREYFWAQPKTVVWCTRNIAKARKLEGMP